MKLPDKTLKIIMQIEKCVMAVSWYATWLSIFLYSPQTTYCLCLTVCAVSSYYFCLSMFHLKVQGNEYVVYSTSRYSDRNTIRIIIDIIEPPGKVISNWSGFRMTNMATLEEWDLIRVSNWRLRRLKQHFYFKNYWTESIP